VGGAGSRDRDCLATRQHEPPHHTQGPEGP
jgi:hypothetical protein